MKKVLFVANVLAHITSFHLPYLELLQRNGYEVHIITNANGKEKPMCCAEMYDLPICRSPFRLKNIKALKQAKKIIKNNNYALIHSHTPMGGVVGRLAGKQARKAGTKMLYTSHGFHFYEGAPLVNWLLYYSMEKLLAKQTDCLVTINREDYDRAKKFVPKSCTVEYMDGVGVDPLKFISKSQVEKLEKRVEYGFSPQDKIALYAAEFIYRKNHEFLIRGFQEVVKAQPNVKLLLAGIGPTQDEMRQLVDCLGLTNHVEFLGYRKDIPDLLSVSDIVVSTSRQEGFPINVAEGIMTQTPCVVSDIRGNIDIIKDGHNGYVYHQGDMKDFTEKIVKILSEDSLREKMATNCEEMADKIAVKKLVAQMATIYAQLLNQEIKV